MGLTVDIMIAVLAAVDVNQVLLSSIPRHDDCSNQLKWDMAHTYVVNTCSEGRIPLWETEIVAEVS